MPPSREVVGDWWTTEIYATMAAHGRHAVISRMALDSILTRPIEMTEIAITPTVHDLRRRWKPHKERLQAAKGEQATSIRFHRACSRMARVEQMPEGQDHDLGVVGLWIAFNSLYGQWDSQKREPRPDRESGGRS